MNMKNMRRVKFLYFVLFIIKFATKGELDWSNIRNVPKGYRPLYRLNKTLRAEYDTLIQTLPEEDWNIEKFKFLRTVTGRVCRLCRGYARCFTESSVPFIYRVPYRLYGVLDFESLQASCKVPLEVWETI